MKIAIVTDSTADLPAQLMERWKVFVVPLKVCFGQREYSDFDLSPEDFYALLVKATELPKTSQPSPEEFAAVYKQALAEHDAIILIHVAAANSGTFNSACLAAKEFGGQVYPFDSRSISLGMAHMVIEAGRGIEAGLTVDAVLTGLTKFREAIEVYFTMDTLEYLHKGGRIGAVKGLLGSLLNIKPLIRVDEEGLFVPAGMARSQEKALCSIVSALKSAARGRSVRSMGVAHGAAPAAAARLKDKLESAFGVPVSLVTKVGPVIGVHSGPGTVGVAVVYA